MLSVEDLDHVELAVLVRAEQPRDREPILPVTGFRSLERFEQGGDVCKRLPLLGFLLCFGPTLEGCLSRWVASGAVARLDDAWRKSIPAVNQCQQFPGGFVGASRLLLLVQLGLVLYIWFLCQIWHPSE